MSTTNILASSKSRSFEKLNHNNFHTWETRVKAELMKQGVWRLCSGEEITLGAPQDPGEPVDSISKDKVKLTEHDKLRRQYQLDVRHYNKALQRNDRAIGIITRSVEAEQLIHFKDKTTAKGVWDAIKVQHADVNTNLSMFDMKVGMLEKKYTDGEDLHAHFNAIISDNQKLGVKAFDDEFLAELLLMSLPRDSVAWESLAVPLLKSVTDANPLKSEDVVKRCMVQYQHLNRPDSNTTDLSTIAAADTSFLSIQMGQSKKSSGGCGYCGYPRHTEEVCRKKKKAAKASGAMDLNKGGLKPKTTELGGKRKNIEVDKMEDSKGEVHVGTEDLGELQTKRMEDGDEGEANGNGFAGPMKKKMKR